MNQSFSDPEMILISQNALFDNRKIRLQIDCEVGNFIHHVYYLGITCCNNYSVYTGVCGYIR